MTIRHDRERGKHMEANSKRGERARQDESAHRAAQSEADSKLAALRAQEAAEDKARRRFLTDDQAVKLAEVLMERGLRCVDEVLKERGDDDTRARVFPEADKEHWRNEAGILAGVARDLGWNGFRQHVDGLFGHRQLLGRTPHQHPSMPKRRVLVGNKIEDWDREPCVFMDAEVCGRLSWLCLDDADITTLAGLPLQLQQAARQVVQAAGTLSAGVSGETGPTRRKKRQVPLAEAEKLVRAYLARHPHAARSEVAEAVGCSPSQVSRTAAWREHAAKKKPYPRASGKSAARQGSGAASDPARQVEMGELQEKAHRFLEGHTGISMSQDDVVKALLEGIERGELVKDILATIEKSQALINAQAAEVEAEELQERKGRGPKVHPKV